MLGLPHSRRQLLIGAAMVGGIAALTGCGGSTPDRPEGDGPATRAPGSGASGSARPPAAATPTPSAKPPAQLPRGGRTVFPEHRLFGYSGAPNAPGQGRLGIGDLAERVVEMEQRAQPYAQGRTVMPIMELIATTVHGSPGRDGMYRSRIDDAVIEQWLAVAREHKAMLLLNIQPGRADFVDELEAYRKWFLEPEVGAALDPEWAVSAGQVPGKVFGHTTGAKLNECAAWLAALAAEQNLPEKVMVYHQLNPGVVRKEQELLAHKGVAMVKSVDGIGSPAAKIDTWKRVVKQLPAHVHPGFKLFYEEDKATGGRLMTPDEVMGLAPVPEYVLFE